jgi:hypothetical protein
MYAFTIVGDEFTIFVEALTIHKIYVKFETVLWRMKVPVISTKATREELNTIAKKYNLGSIIDNIYEMQGTNFGDVYKNYMESYEAVEKKIREVPKLKHNIDHDTHYSELLELLSHSYKYHLNLLAWCYRIEDWYKMRHVKLLNRLKKHIEEIVANPKEEIEEEIEEEEINWGSFYQNMIGNYLYSKAMQRIKEEEEETNEKNPLTPNHIRAMIKEKFPLFG